MLASCMHVSFLVVAILTQLPANGLGKAVKMDQGICISAIYVEDQENAPGILPWPGPVMAASVDGSVLNCFDSLYQSL